MGMPPPSGSLGLAQHSSLGIHRVSLFGNQGAYQTYFLGSNDSGNPADFDVASLHAIGEATARFPLDHRDGNVDLSQPATLRLRAEALPNTFVVAHQNLPSRLTLLEPIGIDQDHVRVFPC
jgi:hypothetical protein